LPPEVEPTTTGEGIVQGLSKFGTSTFIAGGLGKVAGLTGKGGAITNITIKSWAKGKDGLAVGKILAPALNGMIGDATAFWQDKENLSTIIANNVDNPYIKQMADWLAIKGDDDVADRMLKQSLEGLFTAGAVNGIFKTLKGIKKAGAAAVKQARLAKSSAEFAKDIEALRSIPKVMEEKGATAVVKKGVNALQEEVENLGVTIPRNPEVISVEQAKKSVARRIIDLGWGEADVLTPEQLSKLSKQAESQVEKVLPALKSEENVFLGSLIRIKEAGKDFIDGAITKEERNQYFLNYLSDTANAFGKTQDMLYESGKALGVASQNETHRTIKQVLQAIQDNADELTKDKLFDIFSGAKTVEELREKLLKLGYIDAKKFKGGVEYKAKRIAAQITALEQAGLMSNFGTVGRNIFTSLEMGVENILSRPFAAGVSAIKRRLFRNGLDVSGVEAKEAFSMLGAYWDSLKDATEYWLDKIARRQPGEPFWTAYRNSASRKAMTNLPKEVGESFREGGPLSKLISKYVEFSGVGFSEKIDNFFEATFYRGEARARSYEYAMRIGRQKNLSEKEIKALYKRTLDRVMDVDINQAKNTTKIVDDLMSDNLVEMSIAKKAREGAAKSTFRGGRGYITENVVGKVMDAMWFARPFIPFFKTGSTIFLDRFIGDLTPAGIFSRQFWRAMKHGGREMDETLGKMMLGSGLMLWGTQLAANGRITGDYSSDPEVRAAQIAAGWQPNSMVFDNDDGTKRYISLDYLGPLSMCLKYPAKIMSATQDYRNSLKFYQDENFFNKMSVVASAVAADAMDEVSLRYFADGIALFRGNKPDEILGKMGEGMAKLPIKMIPREISEAVPIFSNPEQAKKMVDGIGDEIKKAFGVPTDDMYDCLGKQIKDKSYWWGIIGAKTKKVQGEEWLEHLANIGVGFEMPKTSIVVNSVRLEITPTQANNIKKELGELKVYEHLKRTCSNKAFMEQSKEMQKDIVDKLYSGFRDSAIYRYYQKDADLQAQMKDILKQLPKKYQKQKEIPSMDIAK